MTSRLIRALGRVATLLPLFLALELGNAPEVIAELFGADEADCCGTGCQDAPVGQKCPPRCSTCACPQAQVAMPGDARRAPPRAPSCILHPAPPSRAVPDPDREPIFHPPRA